MSRRRLPPSQSKANASPSPSLGSASTNATPSLSTLSRPVSTHSQYPGPGRNVPDDRDPESDSPSGTESTAPFQVPRSLINSPEKIYQMYLASERKVSQMEAELVKLRTQLAESEIRFVAASSKVRSGAMKQAVNQIAEQDPSILDTKTVMKLIQKLGSHFQVFFCPFVKPRHFSTPRPDFEAYELGRYATGNNINLGITADLYECIPDKFHNLLLSPSSELFSEKYTIAFRKAVMVSRLNSLKSLRESAAAIFDLPADCFSSESTALRDRMPEIQQLMGCFYDDDGNLTYMRIAPVICRDGDTVDPSKYFLSPYLFKIARIVLFGKSAISNTSRAVSRSVSQFLRTDIAAETTFGLIAWVCMMARYLLSTDAQFENNGIGAQTKIPYGEDFAFYKCHMIEYYHGTDTTALIQSLLETWDREVFSNHNKQKGHAGDEDAEVIDMDADPDGSEIAASLARLRLQSATRANTPIHTDYPPSVSSRPIPQPITHEDITDRDDSEDIYGDKVPPSPDSPIPGLANLPIAAPAALNPPAASNPDPVLIPRPEEPQHSSDGATSAANPTTETFPAGPKPRHATQKPAPIPKATRNSKGAKVKPVDDDEPSDKIDIIHISQPSTSRSQPDSSTSNAPATRPKRRTANYKQPTTGNV